MRDLPPPSLANLNPPVSDYRYFDHAPRSFDAAGKLDSARNRWLLSECALLAYDKTERMSAAFADPARQVTPVAGSKGGFCFAVPLDEHDGLLGFRGTQVFKLGEGLEKFRDTAGNYLTNARLSPLAHPGGGHVHQGFHDSANDLVERLQRGGLLSARRRWWLCGHSLGGALAVLAAQRLHADGHEVGGVLTFGQPRVGDAAHAQALKQLPFRILRVVHGCDVIPSVPPEAFGFTHAGDEQVFGSARRAGYFKAVLENVMGLWQSLRHGPGALVPLALRDHAPIYYATHCYNAFLEHP